MRKTEDEMEAWHRSEDLIMNSHNLTAANVATTTSSREVTGTEEKADQTIRERRDTILGTATPPTPDRRGTFLRWGSARKTGAGTARLNPAMARPGEIKTRITTNQTRVGHEGKTREEGPRRKTATFDLA